MATVLLIEDEEFNRDIILQILNFGGYETISAENGEKGLKLVTELMPDLILCDIMMPTMNGYDVYNALKENPKTASIPIVFLTAKNTETDIDKDMQSKADGFLIKPVEIEDLLNLMKKILG